MNEGGSVPTSILDRLIGEELAMVVFVQDYLQLGFDGPILSAYAWPVVRSPGGECSFGEPGYRDALCDLIGRPVVAVEESVQRGLVLDFRNAELQIRPPWETLVGPEIAMLQMGPPDREWMVWQPGLPPFEESPV